MKAREIMTKDPVCCTPDDTVQQAARLMAEHDCGCIPVVSEASSRKIIGTITDRDIAVRCTSEGKSPDTMVRDVMSANPACCGEDDDVKDIERVMSDRQVRRVPIVDREGCCIGMVSQADLARAEDRGLSDREVGRLVEKVSEPTRGVRLTGDKDRAEVR